MHWEMCGNCRIFLHFLLFPLLLSEPPETHKDHRNLNLNAIALSGLTLSRFQINCVRDYVFQFHEFQLESVGYPAIRAVGDPFPLITDDGLERKGCPMHSHCSVTANGSMVGPRHPRRCTRSAISHRLDTIGVCVFMGCVQPCTCHPTGVSKPLLSLRISHDRSAQHTRFRCFHAPQTGRRTTGRAGFRKRRAVLLQMNARNVNCVQWRSLNGVEGGTQLPLTI